MLDRGSGAPALHCTSTTLTRFPPSVWIGRVPLPQLGGLSTTALALGPPNILRAAVQNCDLGGERGWVRGAEFKAGFRASLLGLANSTVYLCVFLLGFIAPWLAMPIFA